MPFVAWPGPSLPGWAGSLDLVVVLAPEGSDTGTASAVAEAVRRGDGDFDAAWMSETFEAYYAASGHATITFNNLLLEPLAIGSQILSLTVFERVPLYQVLTDSDHTDRLTSSSNQLNLFS